MKRQGRRGQGVIADAWGEDDIGSMSQRGNNLGSGWEGCSIDMWLVDKN